MILGLVPGKFVAICIVCCLTSQTSLISKELIKIEQVPQAIIAEVDEEPMATTELTGRELYESYVDSICEEIYPDVPPEMIKAMIERESRFQPDVLGDHGTSYGLMQIKPKWHKARMARLGVTDLLDPYSNILVGCDLMHELISKYNSYACALMVYNGGAGYGVSNYKKGIISNYAKDILEQAGLKDGGI